MVFVSNYKTLSTYYPDYTIKEDFKLEVPKSIILIHNEKGFHYEIIESILLLYEEILGVEIYNPEIYLHMEKIEESFEQYMKQKYPNIKWGKPSSYDYFIECSFYEHQMNTIKNDGKHKYIAHEITNRLLENPNVIFLTPLSKKNFISTHYLPFREMKNKMNKIPIYIVQGNLMDSRRDFQLLATILEQKYPFDFRIKLVGRGQLPKCLEPFKEKIIIRQDLNFQDFHQEFLDAYCILTLISKEKNPGYYKNKLTSSINYIKGYNLKCIIDSSLNEIYQIQNSYTYDDTNEIVSQFYQSLFDFYQN